ncbi:hypothetical protein BKA66DRAFT_136640 [Pyrenochaeta sp. MPI-SDFR-AT-0127]|nr:hypothetical protein BKA66DRAFT_136640 [Pyrenochaeta sp. MPI-SDFR-AT-0127]
MDPTKQSVIHVKCKTCGLPDKDYQPLWCARSGKYVARRRRCIDKKCIGRLTIPQDSQLRYVAYCGLGASADTLKQGPPEFTCTRQVFPPQLCGKSLLDGLVQDPDLDSTSSKRLVENSRPHSSKLLAVPSASPSPTSGPPVTSKGYNAREARQFGQVGEKGPFKYWHGRKPVMNKMGRVRIWVLRNEQSATMNIQRLDFSTYGPYLLKTGSRILDFNDRGVSLLSPEGKELWHASLDQLRLRKNGGDLVDHHRHELEQQRQ